RRLPGPDHARGAVAAERLEAPALVLEHDDRELGPLEPVPARAEAPDAVVPAPRLGPVGGRILVVDEHVPGALEIDGGGARRTARGEQRRRARRARDPGRHPQMLLSTCGKLRHTGTPQKWLPSVQRGLASPSRTKQGGPTWRTSS